VRSSLHPALSQAWVDAVIVFSDILIQRSHGLQLELADAGQTCESSAPKVDVARLKMFDPETETAFLPKLSGAS